MKKEKRKKEKREGKMVVALGPGRFYGRTLPRPRFYPDPKLNPTRVDPPESVSDPLLSWANEAHWSMGGLSFRRLRLQGSIEGSIAKLRGSVSSKKPRFTKERLDALDESESESEEEEVKEEMVEDDESEEEEVVVSKKRKRARRLGDEFDKIAEQVKKGKGNSKENKKGVKKESKKGNGKVNGKGNREQNKKGNKRVNGKGDSGEDKKGKEMVRRISPRKK
ncbi:hypothetical protein LUZ60_007315 [Juncus effusus]|nr:hypothetical protein LUZ60_007315 [Juncus effusus]